MSFLNPKVKCPVCGYKESIKALANAGLLLGKDEEGYILVKCKCGSILRYSPISRGVVGYVPKEEATKTFSEDMQNEETDFSEVSPDSTIFGHPNTEDFLEMSEIIQSWLKMYSHMDIIAVLTSHFCSSIATAAQEGMQKISQDKMQEFFNKVVFDSLSRLRKDFEKSGLKWNV